jgi:hypothetical protein
MWLKTTDGQWVNADHIIRIYLHDVHQSGNFETVDESPVLGRKALADLVNGHTVNLAYFANNGNLDSVTQQFENRLQASLQQGQSLLNFPALGYLPLPGEAG